MSLEISLLHTLVRLSRRTPRALAERPNGPTLRDLVDRLGDDPQVIVRALRSLARQGLVQRNAQGGVSLTLSGLAIAVASKAARKPRAKRLPGMAIPLVRRRSAA